MYEPCYWDHADHKNKAFFSWQIMFTSKFKNTHAHLEEMPSRFLCDLSGHICSQYCLACGQLSFNCFVSALVHKKITMDFGLQLHTCMQPFRYDGRTDAYHTIRTVIDLPSILLINKTQKVMKPLPRPRAGITLLLLDENYAFGGANSQGNHAAESHLTARWSSLLNKTNFYTSSSAESKNVIPVSLNWSLSPFGWTRKLCQYKL